MVSPFENWVSAPPFGSSATSAVIDGPSELTTFTRIIIDVVEVNPELSVALAVMT